MAELQVIQEVKITRAYRETRQLSLLSPEEKRKLYDACTGPKEPSADILNKFALANDKRPYNTVYTSSNERVPLCEVEIENVEFIGGLWRLQDPIPEKIYLIRDKESVLGEKLKEESNHFEYYKAMPVGWNCYGLIMWDYDYIVAIYDTKRGKFCSYGRSREQARAFLGIKLYEVFSGLINEQLQKQKE